MAFATERDAQSTKYRALSAASRAVQHVEPGRPCSRERCANFLSEIGASLSRRVQIPHDVVPPRTGPEEVRRSVSWVESTSRHGLKVDRELLDIALRTRC